MDGAEGIPDRIVVVVGKALGMFRGVVSGKLRISAVAVAEDRGQQHGVVEGGVKDAAVGGVAGDLDGVEGGAPGGAGTGDGSIEVPVRHLGGEVAAGFVDAGKGGADTDFDRVIEI